MPITSIIRSRGGTMEREVKLADIVIHDMRLYALFLRDKEWVRAILRYHAELTAFLEAVRRGEMPEEFCVVNLWDAKCLFPPEEGEILWDMCALGHELADALGYGHNGDPESCSRGGVRVSSYVAPAHPQFQPFIRYEPKPLP